MIYDFIGLLVFVVLMGFATYGMYELLIKYEWLLPPTDEEPQVQWFLADESEDIEDDTFSIITFNK